MAKELTTSCKSFSFWTGRTAGKKEKKHVPGNTCPVQMCNRNTQIKQNQKSFFPNYFSDDFRTIAILCSLTVICAHSSVFFFFSSVFNSSPHLVLNVFFAVIFSSSSEPNIFFRLSLFVQMACCTQSISTLHNYLKSKIIFTGQHYGKSLDITVTKCVNIYQLTYEY